MVLLRKHALTLSIVASLASGTAVAETFSVQNILVEGINRVSEEAVLSYLPITVGQRFDTQSDTAKAIRALYKTQEFDDIVLSRDGQSLIVTVKERASIAAITLNGNKKVDDDMLSDALKGVGIQSGRPYNPVTVSVMNQELRKLYLNAGYYGVKATFDEKKLDRNRVGLTVNVNEGAPARIRSVKLVGNKAISDEKLLGLMESGPTRNPFSSRDNYSSDKLEADIERIRSYYLDRGYLKFTVESSQVALSEDKRDIFVTINVSEGDIYNVGQIAVVGDTVLPASELRSVMDVSAGEVFSRKSVRDSNEKISDALGEEGFAFADVNIEPQINESSKEVDLTFKIDGGKQTYIRRIVFSGNASTYDEVLRREMRLFEGAPFSPEKLKRSKIRLQRLGYIDNVNVDIQRVKGVDDLVDIYVKIEEGSIGSIVLSGGVNTEGDITLGASIDRDNVFGTGQRFKIGFEQSDVTDSFEISLTDPYFTDDGISRTLKAYYRQTDASNLDSTADWINDASGLSIGFGVPLSEFTRWRFGAGYERNKLTATSGTPDGGSTAIAEGTLDGASYLPEDDLAASIEEQSNYEFLTANIGLSYDTRDRVVFPENGVIHRLDLEATVPNDDAEFYKLGYGFRGYSLLGNHWVGSARLNVDYGDGFGDDESLPFFKRYYAGGIRNVRGYRSGSLGPTFTVGQGAGDAKGGDFRTTASFALVTPPPFSDPENSSVRLSLFYDMGTVFSDVGDFEVDDLRQSAGLGLIWRMPFGALTFSIADTLNDESTDDTQSFQFTIGTVY